MPKTVKRQGLSQHISENLGVGKKEAFKIMCTVFSGIVKGLAEDGIVDIRGFGKFKLSYVLGRKSNDCLNPGSTIKLPDIAKVSFSMCQKLRRDAYFNKEFSERPCFIKARNGKKPKYILHKEYMPDKFERKYAEKLGIAI